MANAQTLATAKYNKKNGIIQKSYRMKQELADAFKEACEKSGVSQAAKLAELMQGFVDEVNNR